MEVDLDRGLESLAMYCEIESCREVQHHATRGTLLPDGKTLCTFISPGAQGRRRVPRMTQFHHKTMNTATPGLTCGPGVEMESVTWNFPSSVHRLVCTSRVTS